jgi:hypothetical protein
MIVTSPLGGIGFPSTPRGVKVVGKFGYDSSTTPAGTFAPIKEACILQSLKVFKATPFGVTGSAAGGQVIVIPGWHPDVMRTLRLYKMSMT